MHCRYFSMSDCSIRVSRSFVQFLCPLHKNCSYYASILLIAFTHPLCQKFCRRNRQVPTRVLKGAFYARLSLPRNTTTWNVQVVLDCISKWGDTHSLSLKLLTYKLVMLMALVRPSRSADLASLIISKCQFKRVSFLSSDLAMQSRQGKPLTDIFFATFPGNKELRPVETLRRYQTVTSPLRKEFDQLFVATVKPHKPVAPCTIARWLKEVLKLSGIDDSIFTAHSTRSALASAAVDSGVTS